LKDLLKNLKFRLIASLIKKTFSKTIQKKMAHTQQKHLDYRNVNDNYSN